MKGAQRWLNAKVFLPKQLEQCWADHLRGEFDSKEVEVTLGTIVEDASVNLPVNTVSPKPPQSGGWSETVDWGYVRQEVYGKGTTVKQIQREVDPRDSLRKVLAGVFREQVGRQILPGQVTIRLEHRPAEKTQIDFCDSLFH